MLYHVREGKSHQVVIGRRGGYSFASQPGYHADAITFSEAFELLLGTVTTS